MTSQAQSIQKWIMVHDSLINSGSTHYISFDASGFGVDSPSPNALWDVNGSGIYRDNLTIYDTTNIGLGGEYTGVLQFHTSNSDLGEMNLL